LIKIGRKVRKCQSLLRENYISNIFIGNVYEFLDSLVENELLKKVKTEKDRKR
jgi:hypothetical protein